MAKKNIDRLLDEFDTKMRAKYDFKEKKEDPKTDEEDSFTWTEDMESKSQTLDEKYRLKVSDLEDPIFREDFVDEVKRESEMHDFVEDLYAIEPYINRVSMNLDMWYYEKEHNNLESHLDTIERFDMIDFSNPYDIEAQIKAHEQIDDLLTKAIKLDPQQYTLKDNYTQWRIKTKANHKRLKRLQQEHTTKDFIFGDINGKSDFKKSGTSFVDKIRDKWSFLL